MWTRHNKSLRISVGLYKEHFRIYDRDRVVVAEGVSLEASAGLESG
jgi:hypothetical protein